MAVPSLGQYGLEVRNGSLHFEDVRLDSLAKKYGTPLFVYSERMIVDAISKVQEAFRKKMPNFKISYAVKAASNLRVLKTVRDQGVGAEVSSEGEIFLALMAGFNPGNIIFNGPAKSDRELAISARLGFYCINLDSTNELERLYAMCKRTRTKARIAFRVRPDVGAGTKSIQTGTVESKFGLGSTDVLEACRRSAELQDHLQVIGIHAHVGSQNTSRDSWRSYVEKLTGLAATIRKEEPRIDIQHINIGGGMPVKHYSDDLNQPVPEYARSVPSEEQVASIVSGVMDEEGAGNLELILEPGRRIVANSALLVTQIVSTKSSNGQDWVYVDAGYNTLPSANIPWYFHVLPVSKASAEEFSPYRVAGPLCDSHDLFHDVDGEEQGNPSLPRYRMLPNGLHSGDYLAFLDVGAYNMDIMDNFNGRLLAGGIFIDRHGKPSVMRKRQKYGDIIHYELHSKRKSSKISKLMEDMIKDERKVQGKR